MTTSSAVSDPPGPPAAAPDSGPPRPARERPTWLGGAIGVLALLVVWWLLAITVFHSSGSVPTPWSVLKQYPDDGWHFYSTNAGITLKSAGQGFVWGNGLALVVALLVLLVPPLEAVATQLAVISYCMPLTAIGPIILVIFGGRAPSIFLAALSVFFTTLVGALLGLKAADRASLQLIEAYGGSRRHRLIKVQLIAALPNILSALKIAAPAAMLGAIIGEYLGGVDNGLGVVLTVSQQQFLVPRTWALAILIGALAGLGYAIFALIARFVTPWTTGTTAGANG